MSWIRENKFLTAFIAILVIGAGGLSYLLFTAYGTWSDVTDQYNAQAAELHRLQNLSPYPDQQNLTKYRAELKGLIEATGTLASRLHQMEQPIADITPSAFQDRLRDITTAIKAKADRTGVTLAQGVLALGFDQYQVQPPPSAAAAPLGRQLAALNIALNILIDDHVEAVEALTRTPLPEEGAGGREEAGRFGRRRGEENAAAAGLVEKVPFEVRFTAGQAAFQKVLNDFASSASQFFITRTLAIENSDPKPVAKSLDTSAAPAAPAAPGPGPGASSGTSGSNFLTFIVGTEKVNVAMRIDMVTFNPPEEPARR